MLGLGAMVGTGIFVSIGHAAELAGSWALAAIAVAAVVACLNGLGSAQLAAAHPVSGGTYEYGYRWLHPSLGFTAGWMFLGAKSASAATAALGFGSYGMRLLAQDNSGLQVPLGLGGLVLITVVLLAGIRWSSLLNAVVVTITLASLVLFVVVGCGTLLMPLSESREAMVTGRPSDVSTKGFLEACALMFVAYTGYGRIATLGEEIRNPEKYIPIGIIVTVVTSMFLYLSVAWVALAVAGPAFLGEATRAEAAPLESVAAMFLYPEVRYGIAMGAVTAMFGVLINLVLGLSRVVLAMGRRGDFPRAFSRLDASGRTAPLAVMGVSAVIAILIALGNVKTTWAFSAFSVLIYYGITNLAAIKMSDEERRYPRLIPWLGFVCCLFLAFWVDAIVWLAGLAWIAMGLCWWRYRLQVANRNVALPSE